MGVLAYDIRGREYLRRVLRSIGLAPLIFTTWEEFMAMGEDLKTLDALIIDELLAPNESEAVFQSTVREAIGTRVPMMHVVSRGPRARVLQHVVGVRTVHARSFSDLYLSTLSFLQDKGIPTPRQAALYELNWPPYQFNLMHSHVTFEGHQVSLKRVMFDVGLELFFNVGRRISPGWMRMMVQPARRARAINLNSIVSELGLALQLNETNGWSLGNDATRGFKLERSVSRKRSSLPVPRRTLVDPSSSAAWAK